MAGVADGIRPGPRARSLGKRRAAGIYGAIITAALLATAGDELHTGGLVAAVLITLLVYWLAEEYAELLGEQVEGGLVPTWDYIREALAETWPRPGRWSVRLSRRWWRWWHAWLGPRSR